MTLVYIVLVDSARRDDFCALVTLSINLVAMALVHIELELPERLTNRRTGPTDQTTHSLKESLCNNMKNNSKTPKMITTTAMLIPATKKNNNNHTLITKRQQQQKQ